MSIRKRASTGSSMARRHDKHVLYERAVQDPPSEVRFVERTFKKLRKRPARTLREDFAGTSIFSLEWARTHPKAQAWAIDLDGPTLDWGRRHRIEPAGEDLASRVHQVQANVLDGEGPSTDITVAFNFSYWIFETREELRRYFEVVREGMEDDGLFFVDVFGGYEVPRAERTANDHGDFTYVWEQKRFDVFSNHMDCAIHFEFEDGSALRNAFTYSWRVWSIPELRELMLEAGFTNVHLYWERQDDEGEGTGKFFEPRRAENEPVWWTFIVAER